MSLTRYALAGPRYRFERNAGMKIAYLMNTYPMTSTTFVRREIEALERLGLDIKRYAIRVWREKLVDVRDVAEIDRTHYMLTGNTAALVAAFIRELLVNPRGAWRGIRTTWQLAANAGGLSIKHFAYLLQAAYLRQMAQVDRIERIPCSLLDQRHRRRDAFAADGRPKL